MLLLIQEEICQEDVTLRDNKLRWQMHMPQEKGNNRKHLCLCNKQRKEAFPNVRGYIIAHIVAIFNLFDKSFLSCLKMYFLRQVGRGLLVKM